MRVAGSDRVAHLHHFPFLLFVEHRALVQAIIFPIEAAFLPRRAQSCEVGSSSRRGRARRNQCSPLLDCSVTIHAIDFNGVACLAVKFAVAMAVLFEVAVHAVHPFFEVDVFQMDGLLQFVGIIKRNRFVF